MEAGCRMQDAGLRDKTQTAKSDRPTCSEAWSKMELACHAKQIANLCAVSWPSLSFTSWATRDETRGSHSESFSVQIHDVVLHK